ncbi:PP2C family serine/threonine-protein phosphatase [Streptomyces viridosporus]|uniref:PP2C family serine/threonine-protein phosphatase n=2 Tax=Streptomyces viridosporus TaxID=67581 RepID=UPI003422B672
MSQMSQQSALSKCPSCEEPLESGDRFCGACGYDLSAVPARPTDAPTIALNGSVPPQETAGRDRPRPPAPTPPAPPAGPARPAAGPNGSPAQGAPVPPPPPPPPAAPAAPSSGVRLDRPAQPSAQPDPQPVPQPVPRQSGGEHPPAQPDEYPLQAPDPRVAAESARSAGGPVCVACRAGRVDDDGYCENCGHAQPRERDHMEQEHGPVAAVSDRGLRHHRNEDAFAVGTTALPDGTPAHVAIVCDGVSSATRPDEASLAASRAANESLLSALPRGTHPQQAMHDAIVAAADAVNALADEPATAREHAPHQNAPACTLVGAVVTDGLLVVGWVGDSRVYWVPVDRSAPAARLTEDDSWAAQMVAAGLMGEAEAYADQRAHAITGWLGADAYELEPHTASFKPDRPGVVVVCTDGLWNYAESAEEMARVVPADAAVRPLHGARVLVGHALDGGGHDNVTVALVPFPAVPPGAGSA